MNGSTVSASADRAGGPPGSRDLVISVNWIGDAIMAMPALQSFRRLRPDHHIAVLARGAVADLWSLHAAPAHVIRYEGRPGVRHPLYASLQAERFDTAWILPNSFRAAWIPYRAGIANRVGCGGLLRRGLLTERRDIAGSGGKLHQAWEYLRLMVPDLRLKELPVPELVLPPALITSALERFGSWTNPVVGMIPGAARGPAKRWPADHFTALGRRLVRDGYDLALFGGPDDVELARGIAGTIGKGVLDFTGQTGIAEWAALMRRCRLVVCNDSGGMHLAAALGRPVVALYGMTDPARTGPLGNACTVLQESRQRSRTVARHSREAQKSLASIRPEAVYEAATLQLRSAVAGRSFPGARA